MPLPTKDDFVRNLLGSVVDDNRERLRHEFAPLYELLGIVDRADVQSYADEELTALDRGCQALVGTIRSEWIRREGWQRYALAQDGPGADDVPRYLSGWDHAYRLVHPENKRVVWCAEPYELSAERLRELAKLEGQGWKVQVDADWSIHFPGRTVRVTVERPNQQSNHRTFMW
jgi:hypothetical protein